jgi:hypothetical protein
VAKGYALYHALKNAPSEKQEEYVEAFAAGYSLGWSKTKPKYDQKLADRREDERRRLEKHRRLTRELLAGTDDDDLVGAIIDYVVNKIDNRWGRDYEIVRGLPRPSQLVFAMNRMRNEINRDDFQPLLEWDSPYAPLATEGYRLIGAAQRAAVMERAAAVIDKTRAGHAGPVYAENRALGRLDTEFYALNRTDNLDQLIVKYIRQHPDEFVAD